MYKYKSKSGTIELTMEKKLARKFFYRLLGEHLFDDEIETMIMDAVDELNLPLKEDE